MPRTSGERVLAPLDIQHYEGSSLAIHFGLLHLLLLLFLFHPPSQTSCHSSTNVHPEVDMYRRQRFFRLGKKITLFTFLDDKTHKTTIGTVTGLQHKAVFSLITALYGGLFSQPDPVCSRILGYVVAEGWCCLDRANPN